MRGKPGKAMAFFSKFLSAPPNGREQRIEYQGLSLLTDYDAHYLPSFIVQYCYYLSAHFAQSEAYHVLYKNAATADQLAFKQVAAQSAQWGNGAGAYPSNYAHDHNNPWGYQACAINANPVRASGALFEPTYSTRLTQLE